MKWNNWSPGGSLNESRAMGTVLPLKPVFPVEAFDVFLTEWNIWNVLKAKIGDVSSAQDLMLVSRAFPMILSGQAHWLPGISSSFFFWRRWGGERWTEWGFSCFKGLPRCLTGKESAYQCRRHVLDPWVGKISWRRAWQPTPIFLPGESHGQRSLAGYSP